MNKLTKAFELFDAYNKQDPNLITWEGAEYPEEYFFALRLHEWVVKLDATASEPLLLASRSQHIGRWESPRSSYSDGKAGYLQWRMDLAKFHAHKAGTLMEAAGYDVETIEQTQHIILKKDLKTDPQVQVMENALCLVFLEYQYEAFIGKHDEKKVLRVLQKSWHKMSSPGRDAAFSIDYSEAAKQLLEKALA